jgi:two-component system chemotaxis response regulator CheY
MLSKMLVVDDSRVMHGLYEMTLKRYVGCQVVHAMNGQEALEALARHGDCQLIILDMNMPVMDGLEFIKRYKAVGAAARAPIVIVSTQGKEEERRRGLEAGASAYLTKPFQPTDLQAIIDKMLPQTPA